MLLSGVVAAKSPSVPVHSRSISVIPSRSSSVMEALMAIGGSSTACKLRDDVRLKYGDVVVFNGDVVVATSNSTLAVSEAHDHVAFEPSTHTVHASDDPTSFRLDMIYQKWAESAEDVSSLQPSFDDVDAVEQPMAQNVVPPTLQKGVAGFQKQKTSLSIRVETSEDC
ncbi:hypothetical protein GCK72_020327 [Caenorhabditis remanei]|uniref:Uncharacterized protein n=1 Tax=Caenorhabditis remanei TaxID=31234 RepID=A0A6A5GF79_CAERE|nr:hypothetical protein GCK72_020327 [Caenorhabditis remanei]KAF1753770.1 hypothetical protein GCK72_020327 [Caenorhabditis remanei]